MEDILNPDVYLARMGKPLQEKLKVDRFIPKGTKSLLDVGCADGTVTLALAEMHPEIDFLGIDLNESFVSTATAKIGKLKNVRFESGFLRERLATPEKFDVVLFCSVLHEFFSYGQGISTVVKALADAHEMLSPNGTIIIRDMILYDYVKQSRLWVNEMKDKVLSHEAATAKQLREFNDVFGETDNVKNLNHFLLKYMYSDNWAREVSENYVPVSFEEYDQIFSLLGMSVLFQRSSTIPYLKKKWVTDFGFTEAQLESFRSTGIIVAQKQ